MLRLSLVAICSISRHVVNCIHYMAVLMIRQDTKMMRKRKWVPRSTSWAGLRYEAQLYILFDGYPSILRMSSPYSRSPSCIDDPRSQFRIDFQLVRPWISRLLSQEKSSQWAWEVCSISIHGLTGEASNRGCGLWAGYLQTTQWLQSRKHAASPHPPSLV
jgi:hypothetical protein